MIHWQPYPNAVGEHARVGDVILAAHTDGSWAVWKSGSGGSVKPRASADRFMGNEPDLESAKRASEAAFNEMFNG